MEDKFKLQDEEYVFPYHYLIDLENFSNYKSWTWGIEYYNNMNFVIKKIKNINFESILDIGCGDGRLIYELKKIFPEKKMVGVDLSEQAISFAKAFNRLNKSEFYSTYSEINNVKFDLITLIEVLEHIPDKDIKTITETIKNRLAPGGKLIISVPSDNYAVTRKHYRHYNMGLIKKTFPDFIIKESHFLNKKSIYDFVVWISNSIKIKRYQKFISKIASKIFFQGREDNCTNIVCVLKKGS